MAVDQIQANPASSQKPKPSLPAAGRGRSKRNLPTTTRSYGTMAVAVLLIVGSALAGAILFTRAGDTASVLAVKGSVAKGETIVREDLVAKQVSGVDGSVAVGDVMKVIGKVAAVDLVPGQVITAPMFTTTLVPGRGQALVGMALKPSQMPGDGLESGDTVRVIAVPAADSAGGVNLDETIVLAEDAQVYAVGRGETADDTRIVTVIVPDGNSEKLTSYAAAGRAAVMKKPATGGS